MENKFLIIANLKSNVPSLDSFKIATPEKLEIALAPAFPYLPYVPAEFSRCSQDVSTMDAGAFTGEVCAKILADLKVKYCLVGHSERRKNFGETNETVQKKVQKLKEVGIVPIVCARSPQDIVENEITMYEPEEAISIDGKYHAKSPEEINTALTSFPQNVRLLYGGSVNSENCALIIAHCPLITGFVVGHAALDPQTFTNLISQC